MEPSPTPFPSTQVRTPRPRAPFVAVVLGWLIPGLGHVYAGRPLKAAIMFVAIGSLFYGGLALTAFTGVNPRTYSLEFAAHVFLGAPTAATLQLTQDVVLVEPMRWLEVGRLYCAVAGLLNLVAICDVLGDVLAHNRRVRAVRELQHQADLERLERQAAALRAAEETEVERPPTPLSWSLRPSPEDETTASRDDEA